MARLLTKPKEYAIIHLLIFQQVEGMVERFQTFTVLIAKISRSIRRIKSEEMAALGLKSPHVSCLYYLYKAECLTAKQLCDMCEEDKAAISRSIEYLEREGYIACLSDAKKRYKSPLVLTERGRATSRAIVGRIDRILTEASEGLSEQDRLIFYKAFSLICDNLQNICQHYEK